MAEDNEYADGVTFADSSAYGRALVTCTLPDNRTGAARVPPNGDMSLARRRAYERALRASSPD